MSDLPPKTSEKTSNFTGQSISEQLRTHAAVMRTEGKDGLAIALEEAAQIIEEHGTVEGKALLDAQMPDFETWDDPAFAARRFARGWVSYYDR